MLGAAIHSLTERQKRRALHALAWFTVSVNFGALGLKWTGVVEQGWMWTAVVLAVNVAMIVASCVLRVERSKTHWGVFWAFMPVGAALGYIEINVIKGNYEPNALWFTLLLTGMLVVIGRLAFFPNRGIEAHPSGD